MAKISGRSLSKDSVYQEFDLKEILGMDVSGDDALIAAIGQAIIDQIVDRTKSGKDVNGSSFAPYSESYKKSLDFKAFGKTNAVDMTLTDEMLSMLTILSVKGSVLRVGWNDAESSAKAYGHITGMKGHPRLDGVTPKRDFFGLNETEVANLRTEFRPNFNAEAELNDVSIMEKIERLLGA